MKQAAAVLALIALGACAPAKPAASSVEPPASGAARLMSPERYVAGFYAAEPKWDTPEALRALFEPVLAEALAQDMSHPGEVGNVNFMFTCGCQDGEITQVTTASREIPGGHEVTARFLLEGQPRTVVYKLLTTEAGYRIADVSSPAHPGLDGWSLRGLLGLG